MGSSFLRQVWFGQFSIQWGTFHPVYCIYLRVSLVRHMTNSIQDLEKAYYLFKRWLECWEQHWQEVEISLQGEATQRGCLVISESSCMSDIALKPLLISLSIDSWPATLCPRLTNCCYFMPTSTEAMWDLKQEKLVLMCDDVKRITQVLVSRLVTMETIIIAWCVIRGHNDLHPSKAPSGYKI